MDCQDRPTFVGIDRASGPDQTVVSVWTAAGRREAKRLPPQPTDTRLARAVGRAVKRLSKAFKAAKAWARYNLRFVRAGRYHDMVARAELLRLHLMQAQIDLEGLEQDYWKFMTDIPHARVSAHASLHDEPWIVDTAVRTTVQFDTLNIQSPLTPRELQRRGELSKATAFLLERHARAIAGKHAERIADLIIAQTAPAVRELVKGARA